MTESPSAAEMAELQKQLNPDLWVAHPPKDRCAENWGVELYDPDETAIGHYPLIEELRQSDHEASAKFIAAARSFDYARAATNERRVAELEGELAEIEKAVSDTGWLADAMHQNDPVGYVTREIRTVPVLVHEVRAKGYEAWHASRKHLRATKYIAQLQASLTAQQQENERLRGALIAHGVGIGQQGEYEYCVYCDFSRDGKVDHRPGCVLYDPSIAREALAPAEVQK